MNETTFYHKFNVNETVYYQHDFGVNKGSIIRILLNKELSLSEGRTYNYISYDIIEGSSVNRVLEHRVFATPEEAFK